MVSQEIVIWLAGWQYGSAQHTLQDGPGLMLCGGNLPKEKTYVTAGSFQQPSVLTDRVPMFL